MIAPWRSSGMTLIEVMVALALLSMLCVGMLSTFRLGMQAHARVLGADKSYWDIATTQRFLRHALESSYPPKLEGRGDHVSFIAPMPGADGGSGQYRYEIAVTTRGAHRDLIVRSQGTRAVTVGAREEVLISQIQSIEWAYLGNEAPVWRETWSDERELPAMIRLRVVFPNGDSRRWPDMLVEPRINAAAACEFDVVAQSCREVNP